jgi:hypothetical protein
VHGLIVYKKSRKKQYAIQDTILKNLNNRCIASPRRGVVF